MTDARFPERWLNDRRVTRLSDAAFRLFVNSLAWSVANRTDGVIERQDAELIPGFAPDRAAELTAAGLWELAPQEWWVIAVYADTQSTRVQLEAAERKRVQDRERQARHRLAQRDGLRDVTRDGTREEKGQDRPVTGQASVPATQGEITTPLEEELSARTREGDICASPGCDLPARRSCWTCATHMRSEADYRQSA